jgi:hypothetical protein
MPNYTRNDLAHLGRTEAESHDILLSTKRNLQWPHPQDLRLPRSRALPVAP